MKIKIVSEGDGIHTKVMLEDGTILDNCRSAKWECDAGGVAKVTLRFAAIPAEIQGSIPKEEFSKNYEIVTVTSLGDTSEAHAIVKKKDSVAK